MKRKPLRFRSRFFLPYFGLAEELEAALFSHISELKDWQNEFQFRVGRKVEESEFCRLNAEAVTVAALLCRQFDSDRNWTETLIADESDPLTMVFQCALGMSPIPLLNDLVQSRLPAIEPFNLNREVATRCRYEAATQWVEAWFTYRNPDLRKSAGIYFTPASLAAQLTERTHKQVRDQLHLPLGLADETTVSQFAYSLANTSSGASLPVVRIFDFAAGTGVFLLAALNQITMLGGDVNAALKRISGVELMPASCAAARVLLSARAKELGATLTPANVSLVQLGDALRPETWQTESAPPTVILGNPPFLSTSKQAGRWIDDLMRGVVLSPGGEISYYPVAGSADAERKTWLHDDYVRFLRLGQYLLSAGGVMGVVTNRGFLDNLTFRSMRHGLLKGFSHINVEDFGREGVALANDGPMSIRQPIAATVFTRRWQSKDACEVEYRDAAPLQAATHTDSTRCEPSAPDYFLAPDRRGRLAEYEQGVPLNEVMPTSGSAAVTARDALVIGFSRDELLQRIGQFSDLRISDDEIRNRDFARSRSRRYPPGDTRGWKLVKVRRQLAEDNSWRETLLPFQYRPFDQRVIAWDERLIDWPRTQIMRHMATGSNAAIVTRRQAPFAEEYSFITVADSIVVDGLIRNDNRGNETFFPCDLADGEANFSASWLADLQNAIGASTSETPDRRNIFQFVVAQLISRDYRTRYAAELCIGFPRVFFPHNESLFRELADLGARWMQQQLAKPTEIEGQVEQEPTVMIDRSRHYPKWRDARIWFSAESSVAGIDERAWNFKIGSHRVLHKWISSRRGRELTAADLSELRRIERAILQSIEIIEQIDQTIVDHGGWRNAFGLR